MRGAHPTMIMSNYRRDKTPGGIYFFTLVTYQRIWVFNNDQDVEILRAAMSHVKKHDPFEIDAIVILPEHLHLIMQLNEDDSNYSRKLANIKRNFGKIYQKQYQIESILTNSAIKRSERGIWQRRFWEHRIKNSKDYEAHVNYIHYNPVKHKLVQSVADWKWSSYFKFLKAGFYDKDWGTNAPDDIEGVEWD